MTKKVLVTGAAGFLGEAIAKAFRGAGWKTYGMVRDPMAAERLSRAEIVPLIADVLDLSQFTAAREERFDVIVSTTEDRTDPEKHYAGVRQMLNHLTRSEAGANARRPLVMFTSGSKDYGDMAEGDGDAGLRPHTEESPIAPHPFAAARALISQSLLQQGGEGYDVTVVRPALLHGRASGLLRILFEFAAESRVALVLNARPNAIMHSVHVGDCAAAYVALAEHPARANIIGQAFNVAPAEYETSEQTASALAESYGLRLEFAEPIFAPATFDAHLLANTSQWVGSSKIRELTGWSESMPSFCAGISEYRMAYEASKRARLQPA